jgi:hypothetical protein
MRTEAQIRASKKYNAANTRQICLVLNLRTDADILDQLDRQPSKMGYIKDLIREDLKRSGQILGK